MNCARLYLLRLRVEQDGLPQSCRRLRRRRQGLFNRRRVRLRAGGGKISEG